MIASVVWGTKSPGVGIHGVSVVSEIYDSASFQPGRHVGALVSRVKVEILTAIDRELSKVISYDAGAMTRMLDRLEAKGLIRRTRSSQDRRLMNLELTEEGRAAYPRMREISMAVANRFLRGFTKAEARQLEGFLNRMLDNAQGVSARASA